MIEDRLGISKVVNTREGETGEVCLQEEEGLGVGGVKGVLVHL